MHGRNIVVLLALTGLGSAELKASTGYLASIGPAAIRFLDPPKMTRPLAPEPAPKMAPPTEPLAVEPAPVAVNTPTPKVYVPPEPTMSLIVSNFIGDITGMTLDSQYVPPSVLVRYFTGHPVPGVGTGLVPVGFQAPADQPPQLRSSATYEKGP
jgi:hypothetical protein